VLGEDALQRLERRELAAAASKLSAELGKAYVAPDELGAASGTLARRVDLASGRYALLANDREFMLVPWRPVLERYLGRDVTAIIRGRSVSWSLGPQRGPQI
jgi:hypothetical protein